MSSPIVRYPQLAKEALLTSRHRGDPENRVWAKSVDLALAVAVSFLVDFLWAPLGWLVPLAIWSYSDRLGRGQSPGKWLLGLHTIETKRGYRPGYSQGFIRNFPFLLLTWGLVKGVYWIPFLVFPGLLCLAVEMSFVFRLRTGVRVGDVIAGTRVFDFKDIHTKFIEQFLKESDED